MNLHATHTTADGSTFLIATMSDEHLIHTVDMHFRNLNTLLKQLEVQKNPEKNPLGFLDKRVTASPKEVQELYERILSRQSEYIMEAMVRDAISDTQVSKWRKALQVAIGRNSGQTQIGLNIEYSDGFLLDEAIQNHADEMLNETIREHNKFINDQNED